MASASHVRCLVALASVLALLHGARSGRPYTAQHTESIPATPRHTQSQLLPDDEPGEDDSDDDDVTLGSGSGMLLPDPPLDNFLAPGARRPSCCAVGRLAGRRGEVCRGRNSRSALFNGSWPDSTRLRTWFRLRRGGHLSMNTRHFRFCAIREPLVLEKCCQASRRAEYENTYAHARRWHAAQPSSRQRYVAWRRFQIG